MKLYNSEQIKLRDKFTCKKLGLSPFELMTKASKALSKEIIKLYPDTNTIFHVFCGTGNNGGDGMMIAKMLKNEGYTVHLYEIKIGKSESPEYSIAKLEATSVASIPFLEIKTLKALPKSINGVIIDAILGTGIEGNVKQELVPIIEQLNAYGSQIISIDLPSGLPVDGLLTGPTIAANFTLTVQDFKPSFFYEEHYKSLGKITQINIGLVDIDDKTNQFYITENHISSLIKARPKFSHKGDYGHALVIAGNQGMVGAGIMSGAACLRSGVGLTTVMAPIAYHTILHLALPEAMVLPYADPIDKYTCITIGPGIGQHDDAKVLLNKVMKKHDVITVYDADAITLISKNNTLKDIPKNAILTPHPGEFDRLFGSHNGHFERVQTQVKKSSEHQIFIILKSAHTTISTPEGDLYFNTTGNPGMAKGGTGDVLTGLLCGLAAMYKSPLEACLAAVYIHGKAGDAAALQRGHHAMKAMDLIEHLKY